MIRKLSLCLLLWAVLLCACCPAMGEEAETGIVYDDDGGIWDFDRGTYTAPDGRVVTIEKENGSGSGGSGGAITVTDSSGVEGIPVNPDGSITVESGQIRSVEEGSTSSGGLTQEEWEARMQKALDRNGDYTETWYFGPEKDPVSVEVLYVGLGRSMVQSTSGVFLVNTCDLAWASDAPASQALAVVNANRVGYAALRANTSTKSFIMDHCITGSVVRVLSSGKNWTKVDYRGMRGYVLTSSLTFYPNVLHGYETGKICIDGRVTGKSTINIRANANNKARILGDYVLGTPLTIFSRDEKWCEVDVEGWHCYILTEYVSLDEPGPMMAQNN